MRPIDADAFIKWLDVGHLRSPSELCYSEGDLKVMIDMQPTIEPYGKWIYDEYGNPHCSRCEHVQDAPTNYCSECGTDMRGNQNE